MKWGVRPSIIIVSGVFVGMSLVAPARVEAYFEARYFCEVKARQITVTLQKTDKLCLSYVHETSKRSKELADNIAAAQNHIRLKQDVEYWQWVSTALQLERAGIESLKEKMLAAITDFERDLFRKIHALVRYQLKWDREKVFAKDAEITQQWVIAKESGDLNALVLAIQRREYYQKRIALLDRIHFAASFEELMPFLKEYLGVERLRVSVPTTTTAVSIMTGTTITSTGAIQ